MQYQEKMERVNNGIPLSRRLRHTLICLMKTFLTAWSLSRYHCTTSHASENIWKASTKTAAQIHTRFQANTGSRKVRMSSGYTEVGIAIVEKNNQTYVAEIYLK